MSGDIRLLRAVLTSAAFVGVITGGATAEAQAERDVVTPPVLELLFEADLVVGGEVRPFVTTDDPFDRSFSMSRDLVAQGEGAFRGPRLGGVLSWSMLVRRYTEADFGRAHLTGWLETPDGAEIFFSGLGVAELPESGAEAESTYLVTVTFEADEPAYGWLNSTIALAEGSFDPSASTFHYRLWIPHGPEPFETTFSLEGNDP